VCFACLFCFVLSSAVLEHTLWQHKKLKDQQHGPHQKTGINSGARRVSSFSLFYYHHYRLISSYTTQFKTIYSIINKMKSKNKKYHTVSTFP
jgi:hypothetical protein